MQIDIKIAQLLCSRLCHDLAGTSGAVNAGLELLLDPGALSEDGPDGPLGLVSSSARQLNQKLSYYRVAFGFGGGQSGTLEVQQISDLASDFFAPSNVSLDWSLGNGAETPVVLPAGSGKLLLNLLLLGAECLPRGGTLSVRLVVMEEGIGAAVSAQGQAARIKDDTRPALNPETPAETLTAYTVQGHFTALLAAELGCSLELFDDDEDKVQLAVLLPAEGTD